jgi:predicted  nucleic acid-binding Zn-ribbon protein
MGHLPARQGGIKKSMCGTIAKQGGIRISPLLEGRMPEGQEGSSKINNTINSNIIQQTEINNDLYNKIDDNSDKLTALTTRVTNNENTISNHQTTIDNITNRITVLEESVDEIINNSIPTIQVDIDNIQKDITDINTSIEDIVTLVETNSEDISELKDFVENLSIEAISEATINRIYKEIFI